MREVCTCMWASQLVSGKGEGLGGHAVVWEATIARLFGPKLVSDGKTKEKHKEAGEKKSLSDSIRL